MSELGPQGRTDESLADWIELLALARKTALGLDALNELGRAHGLGDVDIGVAMTRLSRRAASLGDRYPFRVLNGIAAKRDAADFPWTWLLLLSNGSEARRQTPLGVAAVHFEQVTAVALEMFFGDATRVARFGWPGDAGRPPEFPDAVRWLAQKMQVEVGASYRPPMRKDGGVDVVAWRPFADGRSGFPVLLTQCTLEQNYHHKASDIDLRVWAGWLRLDVDPATAVAVPVVVPHGEPWNALAARTVVLDRLRLAGLVAPHQDHPRLSEVRAWAEAVLGQDS